MKEAIVSIWIFLFSLSMNPMYGQQSRVDVTIHSRVDTTQAAIKEVADLWIGYLNSEPDRLTDNTHWNRTEKLRYRKFDFSVPYLYQFPSIQLLRYYKPTILSIEKEGDYYGIRTVFSADGLEGEYRKSNPWCITKLYAVRENGRWKLKNALSVITENWCRKSIGKITFVYPLNHKFNEDLARKAILFCNEVSEEFKFDEWKPFEFYVTDSGDDVGKLLNFDFFFAGFTTGVGMNENRVLISGLGSEFYAHEFVHLIVPNFDRHSLIEEGFATWKGGQGNRTLEECVSILAGELSGNHEVSFTDVLDKKWGWEYSAFYTTGAIFFKAAYDRGGVVLVKKLLETPNDAEKLIQTICSVFGLKREEIDSFWRKEVLKFKTD